MLFLASRDAKVSVRRTSARAGSTPSVGPRDGILSQATNSGEIKDRRAGRSAGGTMWQRQRCTALVLCSLAAGTSCVSHQVSPDGGVIPTVSAIHPTSGPIGTIVQLEGSGFLSNGNVVKFGPGYLVDLPSADGRTLSFSVPEGHNQCPPERLGLNEPCRETYARVMPGDYQVSIVTRDNSSRPVTFRVTSQ